MRQNEKPCKKFSKDCNSYEIVYFTALSKIGFSSVSWSLLDRVGNNNSTFSYICDQICCIHTGVLSSAYFPISQHSIHMASVGWPELSGWSGSLPCPAWLLG